MELFLLIAIGLSLISLISIALTKAPQQTFTTNHFLSDADLADGLSETSQVPGESIAAHEDTNPEIAHNSSKEEDVSFPEKELAVSQMA